MYTKMHLYTIASIIHPLRDSTCLHLVLSALMILEDDDAPIELFKDPEGFYKPEPCPTFANYEMRSKESLRLRLVGHNPLWV